MDKQKKYFIYCFFVVVSIQGFDFVLSSIKKFYLFEIDKTAKTIGVITKAELNDGIGARTYECDFVFNVNEKKYEISEVVSVDSVHNYYVRDTVAVIYNLRKPNWGTIDNNRDRLLRFVASICLTFGFSYSIFALLIELLLYIRNKKRSQAKRY